MNGDSSASRHSFQDIVGLVVTRLSKRLLICLSRHSQCCPLTGDNIDGFQYYHVSLVVGIPQHKSIVESMLQRFVTC